MAFSSSSKLTRIPFCPQSKNLAYLNSIGDHQHLPIYKVLVHVVFRSGSYDKLLKLSSREKHQLCQKLFKKASLSFSNYDFEMSLHFLTVAYGLFRQTSSAILEQSSHLHNGDLVLREVTMEERNNASTSEYQTKVENTLCFYALVRMAECFNQMFNYKEADDCLQAAEKLSSSDLRMLLLFAKNTLCDTFCSISSLNQASGYLKRAKEVFSLTRNSPKSNKIEKIETEIENMSKEIKKKKKQIDKRTRINLNQLITKTVQRYSSEAALVQSKDTFPTESVNQSLDDIRNKLLKELNFYKQSRNKPFFEKAMKEYFSFMLVREEMAFILNLKCDLKNLKSCFKNKIISIFAKKQSKEDFLGLFAKEKGCMVLAMLGKLRNGSSVAKELTRQQKTKVTLGMKIKELRLKNFDNSYFCLLSARDFSFLFLFGMVIILFAAFIADL